MDTAVDHLNAALAAMRAARDDIRSQLTDADRQISILERTVAELSGSSAAPAPVEGPSIRDVAREIAARGDIFTLAEVVDAVHAGGNDAKYGSISSILSRMVAERELQKVGKRGTFVISGGDIDSDVPIQTSPGVAEDVASEATTSGAPTTLNSVPPGGGDLGMTDSEAQPTE